MAGTKVRAFIIQFDKDTDLSGVKLSASDFKVEGAYKDPLQFYQLSKGVTKVTVDDKAKTITLDVDEFMFASAAATKNIPYPAEEAQDLSITCTSSSIDGELQKALSITWKDVANNRIGDENTTIAEYAGFSYMMDIEHSTDKSTSPLYGLYAPKNADGSYKKDLPLVVILYNNLTSSVTIGQEFTSKDYTDKFGEMYILLFKRINADDMAGAKVMAEIQKLIDGGFVDKSRVYLTGGSASGVQTEKLVQCYPGFFAAAFAAAANPGQGMNNVVIVDNGDGTRKITPKYEGKANGMLKYSDGDFTAAEYVDELLKVDTPMYYMKSMRDGTGAADIQEWIDIMEELLKRGIARADLKNYITCYIFTAEGDAEGLEEAKKLLKDDYDGAIQFTMYDENFLGDEPYIMWYSDEMINDAEARMEKGELPKKSIDRETVMKFNTSNSHNGAIAGSIHYMEAWDTIFKNTRQ